MDQQLETTFEKLLGRTPSPEEREKLFRVKDALGISTSSPLWLLFVALGHYEALYEQIPIKAEQAAKAAREAADAEIRRIRCHASQLRKAMLANSTAQLTATVERKLSARYTFRTARLTLALLAALFAYTSVVVLVTVATIGGGDGLSTQFLTGLPYLAALGFNVAAGVLVISTAVTAIFAGRISRFSTRLLGGPDMTRHGNGNRRRRRNLKLREIEEGTGRQATRAKT